MPKPWMIYGANGYTGELIAREAVGRGLTPVLVGRSVAKVGPLAASLGLKSRVFDFNNAETIGKGVVGMGVVLHCAGPFSATATPMMAACLTRPGTGSLPRPAAARRCAPTPGSKMSNLILGGMTWSHVDQGAIQLVQEDGAMGQKKTGKRVRVPIHRDLKAELDRVERRSSFILTGDRGRPWKVEGFKSSWQRQHECVELVTGACHGLVLHGLRKSAVCFLLKSGCTETQMEAMTRQSRDMIRHYAANLNRQRLAKQAITNWENRT